MSSSRSVTRSTCHACSGATTRQAPNAPLSSNAAPRTARAILPRVRLRVAGDREVDVVGLAAEQLVADRAADEPHVLAGERFARDGERLAHAGLRGTRWLRFRRSPRS